MHVPDNANSNQEDGLEQNHGLCLPQKAYIGDADFLLTPIWVSELRYTQIRPEIRDEWNSKPAF